MRKRKYMTKFPASYPIGLVAAGTSERVFSFHLTQADPYGLFYGKGQGRLEDEGILGNKAWVKWRRRGYFSLFHFCPSVPPLFEL